MIYSYSIRGFYSTDRKAHFFEITLCDEGTENQVPNTERITYGPFEKSQEAVDRAIELTSKMSQCDQSYILGFFKDSKKFLGLDANHNLH